jgi:methyltransferase (TIGR00027 family)
MKPISRTAFYTTGLRMEDAENRWPIVGDTYAKEFMDEGALQVFQEFKLAKFRPPNVSNLHRHRIIDDYLRQKLALNPCSTIILIGAGFDSRAYRLTGGIWIEVDEPEIISRKEQRLPAPKCPNPLTRISIDFAKESLTKKLAPFRSDEPVLVIIEGVFMYLEKAAICELLDSLGELFPRRSIIGDLMNKRFFEKYAYKIHEVIRQLGATFRYTDDDPEAIFTERGYRLIQRISIVERAVDFGSLFIPKFILRYFLPTLVTGYTVCIFQRV